MNLKNLIEVHLDIERLSKVLDELGTPGRIWSTRQWTRANQATLWEAAKGFRPVTMDDFVPPSVGALVQVIHHGKNSLPAQTLFQKRFCKLDTPKDTPAEMVGYNHQSMAAFTGPGYYVVHPSTEPGEVDIDYTMVPRAKPPAWPPIVPNSTRLAPVVYGGMIDVMRGLSSHVSIGRARKGGGWLDNWFILVREDPRPA